ncbi:MAG: LamG domain-containing protein [Armatimonadetes bacterium]|nr:LamG domain-containing protein [Armatimonadota bacterium]
MASLPRFCLHASNLLVSLVAAWGVFHASQADTAPQPTLQLPFDGTTDGLRSNGKTVAPLETHGAPTFRPGKVGQALLTGGEEAWLEYPGDALDPQQGSVMLWVCPLNWSSSDDKFHVFLEAGEEKYGQGWFLLYKYYQSAWLLFRLKDEHNAVTMPFKPVIWKPGEWHHVVATWQLGRQRLYLDGDLIGQTGAAEMPNPPYPRLLVGDRPWSTPQKGAQTLLDDVMVFSRPLSAREAAAFARPLAVSVARLRQQGSWRVLLKVNDSRLADQRLTGIVALRQAESKQVLASQDLQTVPEGSRADLDVSRLAAGRYEIAVTVQDASGRVLHDQTIPMRHVTPPYRVLENDRVRLMFDAVTGGLVSLRNKQVDLECVRQGVDPKAPFEFCTYSSNQDLHFKEQDLQVVRPGDDIPLDFTSERKGKRQTLSLRWSLQPNITVTATVVLEDGSGTALWRIRVANPGAPRPIDDVRVFKVAFPILDNLCIGDNHEDNVLVRPSIQGEMNRNPVDNPPPSSSLSYLGIASMGWLDLYNPRGGVYFATYDKTMRQCDLETLPRNIPPTVTMDIRKYVFIETGETWQSEPFAVAAHPGDWHWGADRYREWFRATFPRKIRIPDWLKDCDGWLGTGSANYPYSDLPKMLEQARKLGLNYLQIWGEMILGDSYYCYFLPDPERGGEDGMRRGVQAVRKAGGHIGFYTNAVTFDATIPAPLEKYRDRIPDWSKVPDWRKEFRHYAAVNPDGSRRAYSYAEGYSVMCVGAKGWQDYLYYWIVDKYVKDYGVDVWYLDSFPVGPIGYGGPPACFSMEHGDTHPHDISPAAVELVKRIAEGGNKVRPFALTHENAGDLLQQYATHTLGEELAGWNKPKPEIYDYTFPDHIIFSGSCNSIGGTAYYYDDMKPTQVRRQDAMNRVFLMGHRFDLLTWTQGKTIDWPATNEEKEFYEYIRKLIKLRQAIKADLYNSDFRDDLGLGELPKKVEVKVFRRRDGKALVMNILDRRDKKEPFTLRLDCSAHSVPPPKSARFFTFKSEQGIPLKVGGSAISLEIPAHDEEPAAIVCR